MLDDATLGQLRLFIAAVDEGVFSAAGRRMRRAQSVVSETRWRAPICRLRPCIQWWGLAPKGIKVSDAEMAVLDIKKAEFHGEWNNTIAPRRDSG